MHWHLLRIELNWLSRPTGFWLSKEKKQKCHLKNRHKFEKFARTTKFFVRKNKESFLHDYFFILHHQTPVRHAAHYAIPL